MEPALRDINKCVTADMTDRFLRPLTHKEIKDATFQMGALKALGQDGFPGMFSQKYWQEVGEDTCRAIVSFFNGGFLLKELNRTNIVVIPKVANPESLSQFKPISLCNFSVKIICKVLANRLKLVLDKIITPNQLAFVPGRLIQDNIIVAHEAFHYLKTHMKGKKQALALKLDFNKAYDRVQWDFLKEVMIRMGFDHKWVHLIMQIVSTVSYSIVVNGESRFSFFPKRGLKQGDPLSPYLFLLIMDVLSRMLYKRISDQLFSRIRIKRGCPYLTHLFFVDDALLFVDPTPTGVQNLLETINAFGIASGQLINFDKSALKFLANTLEELKKAILDKLGMVEMKSDAKYLGIPSLLGVIQVRDILLSYREGREENARVES